MPLKIVVTILWRMILTKKRGKKEELDEKKGRATYCDYLLPYHSHLLQKRERIYLFWIPNRYNAKGSIVNREKCLYISTSVLPLQTSPLCRAALHRKLSVPFMAWSNTGACSAFFLGGGQFRRIFAGLGFIRGPLIWKKFEEGAFEI